MPIPRFEEMMNPLLEAMRELGGSASIAEMEEAVSEILGLSEEEIGEIHRGNRTKFSYRLAWTRNYLKRYGVLENSARGVWALTPEGSKVTEVDFEEVKRVVRNPDKQNQKAGEELDTYNEELSEDSWRDELLNILLRIDPGAFERLCKRFLRESGFVQVEVTGRSGDGGIDGKGVVKIGGILSFHVVFQCKRYKGSVTPSIIRDFRGAMMGRADKGILITTGSFTRDARSEAQRDGATPIDLIDGDDLVLRSISSLIIMLPEVYRCMSMQTV